MVDLQRLMAAKTSTDKLDILIAVMQEAQKTYAQSLSESKSLTKEQLMEKVVPGIGSTNVDRCPIIPVVFIVIVLIIMIYKED